MLEYVDSMCDPSKKADPFYVEFKASLTRDHPHSLFAHQSTANAWGNECFLGSCWGGFFGFLWANEGFLDVLFRDSKLVMLLGESLGNINCRTTMVAHVSNSLTDYMETLRTLQLASRIHHTGKKKSKVPPCSSRLLFKVTRQQDSCFINHETLFMSSFVDIYKMHLYAAKDNR